MPRNHTDGQLVGRSDPYQAEASPDATDM